MALYKGNEPMALALYKGMAQWPWPYIREWPNGLIQGNDPNVCTPKANLNQAGGDLGGFRSDFDPNVCTLKANLDQAGGDLGGFRSDFDPNFNRFQGHFVVDYLMPTQISIDFKAILQQII